MLRDLNLIAEQTRSNLKENVFYSEVMLSEEFKQKYKEYNKEITFFKSTALFKSSVGKYISFPNTWFVISYYLTPYYKELKEYKKRFDEIFSSFDKKKIAENLFNTIHIEDIPKDLSDLIDRTITNTDERKYFKQFLTNHYKWWHGKKKIERSDFHMSALFNLANLIVDSSSFIAALTPHFAENQTLYDCFQFDKIPFEAAIAPHISEPNVYPKNRILYGAPGTGKSFLLKEQRKGTHTYRITFNPDLTYGQFVGTYKPTPEKTTKGKDIITYKLIPGPFLQALKKAYDLKESGEQVFIIIEELNRANVSAVFGDVFQLLDRSDDGSSEYGITFSSDIMNWLVHEANIVSSKDDEVKIPNNLNIWATMNSADQGVFPLDSAFKRRWTFEYIGIDQGEDVIKDYEIKINDAVSFNWNSLRTALNTFLMSKGINEDKLIGPFFLSRSEMSISGSVEGKLLLYLWEDVLRHKNRGNLFKVNSLSDAHKIIKASTSLENLLRNLFTDTFVTDSKLIPEEN